jgi:hypothetical protein
MLSHHAIVKLERVGAWRKRKNRIEIRVFQFPFFASLLLQNYQLFESYFRRICAVLAPYFALVDFARISESEFHEIKVEKWHVIAFN